MVLPDEKQPLLELHMDSLGTIDVADGTVTVVASLYDSSLLRTIQLSGDMAMYGRFGADPYFLFSVGGYSPDFQPPGYLPASLTGLRRVGYEVSLSDELWFGLSGYVAVTSNTLQFGAEATIEASVTYLDITYTAEGSFGFDVLLVFSPFAFTAQAQAMVTVKAKDTELLAVSLVAHLEGPQPWYGTGYARFEFLGIGVRFDITVGEAAVVQAPPRSNVLDAVIAALAVPDALRAAAPDGETALLAADNTSDDGIERLRPDAELEIVQTVAPLDRTLDVYGAYAIDGPRTLHINDAGIHGLAGVVWEAIDDWFAPAQFDRLSQTEKITAPSYERMSSGVHLKSAPVAFGTDTRSVVPDFEVRVIDQETSRGLGRRPLLGTLAQGTTGLVLATRQRPMPRRATLPQRFDVLDPSWTLADAETGVATGAPGSYRNTLTHLHNRIALDATSRA